MIGRIYSQGQNFLTTIMMESPSGSLHSSCLWSASPPASSSFYLFRCTRSQFSTLRLSSYLARYQAVSVKSHFSHQDTSRKKTQSPASFKTGDKVWLSFKYIHLKVPCFKLAPQFRGPFYVIRHFNPVCYKLQLPSPFAFPIPSMCHSWSLWSLTNSPASWYLHLMCLVQKIL